MDSSEPPKISSLDIDPASTATPLPATTRPEIRLVDENLKSQPVDYDDRIHLEYGSEPEQLVLEYPGENESYSNLDQLLRKYGRKHHESNELFWSTGLLRRILTRERVMKALESDECFGSDPNIDSKTIQAFCDAIASDEAVSDGKRFIRIFAILVLLDEKKDFKFFFHHRICDGNLPFTKDTYAGTTRLILKDGLSIPAPFPTCRWRPKDIDMFCMYQRQMSPQYFAFDSNNYNIPDGTWLPWLGGVSKDTAKMKGGFSTVKKYIIDPDSHGFHQVLKSVTFNNVVAVKTIHQARSDKEDKDGNRWQGEVDMLRRFSGNHHPHLITLLCSFTLCGENNLVFPFAELALDEYWERLPGLKFIHDPQQVEGLDAEIVYGKHGDLKPENILWFRSSDQFGIFVITDLGLTEVHRGQSRSNIPNQDVPRTPGYRPPECDIKGGKLSRAFDIWTLGCLLLEMICWILGGQVMIDNFEKARTSVFITGVRTNVFFDVQEIPDSDEHAVLVKESVIEWIVTKLHGDKSCTNFVHDMLEVIREEMIVVLSPNSPRSTIGHLLKKIKAMHTRVMDEDQTDYIQKPQSKRIPEIVRQVFRVTMNSTAKELMAEAQRLNTSLHSFRGETTRLSEAEVEKCQGD